MIGVTFSIYADQSSSVPLWQEVQKVTVDDAGHYTVLLGTARSEGLPDELFATNDARWLGIRVESEPEQPRTILAAVPYALKAADAETLGGKPLSAFVLNEANGPHPSPSAQDGAQSGAAGSTKAGLQPLAIDPGGGGTLNRIAKWTNGAGLLGDSEIIEVGGKVGINNTNPQSALDLGDSGVFRLGTDYAGPSQIVKAFSTPHVGPASRAVG